MQGDPNAGMRIVKPGTKEIRYNATYNELYAPQAGPVALNTKPNQAVTKNSWNGKCIAVCRAA